jgi:predicted transcriptional regulator
MSNTYLKQYLTKKNNIMTFDEIAEEMGLTTKQVLRAYYSGIEKLQDVSEEKRLSIMLLALPTAVRDEGTESIIQAIIEDIELKERAEMGEEIDYGRS